MHGVNTPNPALSNDVLVTSIQSRAETQLHSGMQVPTVSMAIEEESSRSLKESIDKQVTLSNG
jgi:hypothetical protein